MTLAAPKYQKLTHKYLGVNCGKDKHDESIKRCKVEQIWIDMQIQNNP